MLEVMEEIFHFFPVPFVSPNSHTAWQIITNRNRGLQILSTLYQNV